MGLHPSIQTEKRIQIRKDKMTLYQDLLTVAIVAAVFIWIYSTMKKQSIADTISEIREIFSQFQGETIETHGN